MRMVGSQSTTTCIRCIFVCRFCALVRVLKTTTDGNSIRARHTTDRRESQDIGHCLWNARRLYQFRRAPLLLHNCIAITFAYCTPSRITYVLASLQKRRREKERILDWIREFFDIREPFIWIFQSVAHRVRSKDRRVWKLCSALWTIFVVESHVRSRRSFSSTKRVHGPLSYWAVCFLLHHCILDSLSRILYVYYTCIVAYLETPGAPNVIFSLSLSLCLYLRLSSSTFSFSRYLPEEHKFASQSSVWARINANSTQISFDGNLINLMNKKI